MIQEKDPLNRLQRSRLILQQGTKQSYHTDTCFQSAYKSLERTRVHPSTGSLRAVTWLIQGSAEICSSLPCCQRWGNTPFVLYSLLRETDALLFWNSYLPHVFAAGNVSHSGTSQKWIWDSELSQWKPQRSAYNKVQLMDSCAWVNQCLIT